jgi:hypothetical protein
MRSTVLLAACLAALSACSKPDPAAPPKPSPSAGAQPAASESPPIDAQTAALVNAVKQDFAAQFTATASEACGSVKGQEMPDLKSGSAMTYGAGGVISWGASSFDYVKEPGAHIVLSNSRAEKTFSFGVDIYDMVKGDRRYVAGLSQLKGASLGATVTDETKAVDGDVKLTTGNVCVGSQTPPLVTQGAWALAAKHLQVPQTRMSCVTVGKFDTMPVAFTFDGKTLQAGQHSFTAADAAQSETLIIDPNGNSPGVMYSVSRGGESGAGIGLSKSGALSYAALDLPGGVHMVCSPAQ